MYHFGTLESIEGHFDDVRLAYAFTFFCYLYFVLLSLTDDASFLACSKSHLYAMVTTEIIRVAVQENAQYILENQE